MTNPPIFFEKVKLNMIWVVQASLQKMIKGRCQKKTGKCGNFEKTGGGGGSTRISLPFFFTV